MPPLLGDNKTKIIIIGAGLAGLTAAHRLNQNNFDVEVYEARARVGGRVLTALIKNLEGDYSQAELGAQNIADGGKAINLLNLAKEFGMALKQHSSKPKKLYHKDKNFYNYYDLISTLGLTKEQIEAKIKKLKYSTQSMQQVIDQFFVDERLKEFFNITHVSFHGYFPSELTTYHHIDNLRDRLLNDIKPNAQSIKHTRIAFKEGNATLPLKLAASLGDKIHLNKVLKSVSCGEYNRISLLFHDGSLVECDKLILALPLSVYNDINFAENVISPMRLNMLNKIAYGTASKIFIPIQYIAGPNSLISENMIAFFNYDYRLLTMYFIHDKGEKYPIESSFPAELNIIKAAYKGSTIDGRKPVLAQDEQFLKYNRPVVKSWIRDPYAKGAYSYYNTALGKKFNEYIDYKGVKLKKMFKPIKDKVFFIGEHATMLEEIGTMEGAVESGERISKIILKLLSNKP